MWELCSASWTYTEARWTHSSAPTSTSPHTVSGSWRVSSAADGRCNTRFCYGYCSLGAFIHADTTADAFRFVYLCLSIGYSYCIHRADRYTVTATGAFRFVYLRFDTSHLLASFVLERGAPPLLQLDFSSSDILFSMASSSFLRLVAIFSSILFSSDGLTGGLYIGAP